MFEMKMENVSKGLDDRCINNEEDKNRLRG
jgi:hypothetical protein